MSPHDLHSPWRKSAIMPIWSFQLTLISVDLIISVLILVIINNIPAQTITVGGKKIMLEAGIQEYVFSYPVHPTSCTPHVEYKRTKY